MNTHAVKKVLRSRRRARIRAGVFGTKERPRLAVFRSNAYIYAQLIDDEAAHTLAAADSKKTTGKTPVEQAHEVGKTLAASAKKAGIEQVVFDRGGFIYAGRVKALAEGAREGGLQF